MTTLLSSSLMEELDEELLELLLDEELELDEDDVELKLDEVDAVVPGRSVVPGPDSVVVVVSSAGAGVTGAYAGSSGLPHLQRVTG
ncbi:MAG: hypothetical protein GY884_20520, partial [Proteobacteria bacterium]|nr:hypothetical protein [Pseudomonadota bacterium]